jgi:hypothetical protein
LSSFAKLEAFYELFPFRQLNLKLFLNNFLTMLSESKIPQPKVVAYPYQRKPVIVKGEEDVADDKMLFQKTTTHDDTQKRVHSAPQPASSMFNGDMQFIKPVREIKSFDKDSNGFNEGLGEMDLENNLSTQGQELYFEEGQDIGNGKHSYITDLIIFDKPTCIDFQDRHSPIPPWSELGVLEGEDDEDIPTFDDDLNWLLTAKDHDFKNYYQSSFQDTKDVLLNQISNNNNQNRSSASPSLLKESKGPSPVARPSDEDKLQEKLSSPAVSDIVKDLAVETANDPDKTKKVVSISPKDGKVSPKPGSPNYQKFYSWNDYQPSPKTPSPPSRSRSPAVHSKPTSAEDKAKQQNQRKEKQNQEITKETTDKSKSKKEKDKKENDQQTLLLSKSMPVFPSRESVITSGASLEGGASSAAETNRRSLKGLTHEVFEGNSTDSPYVEHLVKPNKALQILRDAKTMNRADMKGINLTPSSAKNSRKKQPLPNAKNYMIIKEPNDRIANKLLITNPADLQAATMGKKGGAMDKTKFPPIKSNAKFNSNSLLEMVYERPDDLYVKSKLMAEQISSNRSQARLSNKQGVSILPLQRGLSPDHDRTTKNLFEHNHGINFMNTRPISPEIIRSVSPSNNHFRGDSQMDTSNFTNNIDSLLMTMNTSSKPPTAVSSPQGGGVGAKTSFFQSMDKSSFLDASAMTLNDQDALEEAMEMLNSIHIDPLYRIIRDEIETIKAQQEQSAAMAASAAVIPMMNNTTNTSSSRVNSRSGQRGVALQPLAVTNASINPSNIKVLSNFQSLPPSAWALCRITYFLVMAYYETIAMRPDYLEYRRVSQLESLWLILERHYNEENLNTSTINKIFSWPYLQELMAQPALFTKLLECVENGVQLAPNQWKLFQDNVKKRIYQVRKSQLMAPNALDRFKKLRASNSGGGGGSGDEVTPHSQTASPAVEGENNNNNNNNQGVGIAFPHTLLSSSPLGGGGDPSSSSSSSIPAESLTNNEQSRNLFYDLFPIPALHPLRELVSSAKIFLMGTTSSLYHHDHSTPGTSHPGVPGTPLAVTVTLTSWIKRVIALIYISTTQRLKEGRGIAGSLGNNNMNESQEMQLQSVEGSPTIITPGTGGGGTRRALTPTMATTPGMLLTNPKFLHTTHFSDRISSLLILHQPPASQQQQRSNPFSGQRKAIAFDGNDVLLKGVPAYFQISTGLVKPSDDFNVLIMKPVSQNPINKPPYPQQQYLDNNTNDEFQNLLKEVQKHLRTTSGSPLHTVQILPMENYYLLKQKVYTNNNSNRDLNENNLDIHNKSELIDNCFILHDGLLYCLQINDLVFQKYMFFHPEDDQSVGSQAHQLFLQKQLQKNPHAHQLTLAPNISTALNEKFIDLFLTEFKIGQKNHPFMKLRKYTTLSDDIYTLAEKALKEKFTFSVGLISDSMMTRATSTTGMKCSHYAVCINDKRNSWNGFEMARKLAKENDQIYLVYIPMISFWELYEEEFAQQQEEETNNPFSSVLPTPSTHKLLSNRFMTKSSLPYQQYLLLVQRIEQKIERLQATYRSYGYNIILGEIPDYLEVTQRIMNNYSVMMRYNTELFEQEQQLLQQRQQQQEQGQLQGQSVEENKIADDGRLPFEK